MTVALASLPLAGCIPPFVWPHVDTDRMDAGYILPAPKTEPWLRLDNGLDLYAWQDCYAYVLRRDPCEGISLTAVASGTEPDWTRLLRLYAPIDAASNSLVEVVRPLSAHAGTSDRLLGLFRRYEGSPAKDDDIVMIRPDSEDRYNERGRGAVPLIKRRVDIRHDMSASGAETGEIQLVVYNQQHTWVFAGPVNVQEASNLYVPEKLFRFKDGSDKRLSQPMVLYYDDGASQGNARRVVANTTEASNGYRIAFAQMPMPSDTFDVDPTIFRRSVSRDRPPTVLCHYSESEFHASMFDDYQRRLPELKSCMPFSEKALQEIERRRKH